MTIIPSVDAQARAAAAAAASKADALRAELVAKGVLTAAGGTPAPAPLPAITTTTTNATFIAGATTGTVAVLSAVPAGVTRTLLPDDNRLALNAAGSIVVGLSASSAGTINATVQDKNASTGAISPPLTVPVTVTAAATTPAPSGPATSLSLSGTAGTAPSGASALVSLSDHATPVPGFTVDGSGHLALPASSYTRAIAPGLGTFGDGTYTATFAPGSSNRDCYIHTRESGAATGDNQGVVLASFITASGNIVLYSGGQQLTDFISCPYPQNSLALVEFGHDYLIYVDGTLLTVVHDPNPPHAAGYFGGGSGATASPRTVLAGLSYAPLPAGYALPAITGLGAALNTLSTSAVAGVRVGTVSSTTPSGNHNYGLAGPDAAVLYIQGDGLYLRVGQPPLGTLHVTLLDSDIGASARADIAIPVVQGTTLPSSNMTFTLAGPLNNYATGQIVGTPAVTGITGTPSWTLNNRHNNNYAPPGFNALLACDAASARTTIPGMAEEGTETLTWTCTDGINTCTASFSVPIAWYVPAGGKRTVHVGQGMQAAHGADGYEHFRDLMPELANRGGGLSAGNAGMDVQWYWNSDPNYYADDNGGGQNGAGVINYDTRYGVHGPLSFTPVRGPNGELVRIGGRIGAPFGGMDCGGKGFFNKASGDMRINPGFEISWVNGSTGGDPSQGSYTGISAIRGNGGTWGKLEVRGCFFHDNNNGIEAGEGPVTLLVDGCEFGNHGTAYVSSGATHSIYAGCGTQLTVTNNRFGPVNNGHNIKSRAFRGLYTDNTIRGGNRDLASACIDIPDGGHHTVRNNVLVKGANHANDAALQFGVERLTGARTDALVLDGNTYVMLEPPGRHSGSIPVALRVAFVVGIDGSQGTVASTNERFYAAGAAQKTDLSNRGGANGTLTQTGAVDLTVPPAVDITRLVGAARVGPMNWTYDTSQNYPDTNFVQIDLGVEDYLLLPLGTPAGTVIAPAVTAYGNNQFKEVGPNDIRIQPFLARTTWALPQTAQPDGNTVPWAAAGRYSIAVNPDGITATLKVLQPPTVAGVDFLQLLATAPGGIQCQYRAAVCWA